MDNLKLYTIDSSYIAYLKKDHRLYNVFENKEESNFVRKYVGIVLNIGKYKYYVPLSSPKNTDYIYRNGIKTIRGDIIPIIRIRCIAEDGKVELKGTLKLSNMIPVPSDVISYYDINLEENPGYKILIEKEYDFIKRNQSKIKKYATVIYNQKTKEDELYTEGVKKPGYLQNTVDFKYAEYMSDNYLM